MDLSAAHVLSLSFLDEQDNDNYYQVFNLGTGEGVSVMQVIKTFEEVSNATIKYTIGPRRSGDVEQIFASVKRAEKILKWKATKSMKQALADTWKWQQTLPKTN